MHWKRNFFKKNENRNREKKNLCICLFIQFYWVCAISSKWKCFHTKAYARMKQLLCMNVCSFFSSNFFPCCCCGTFYFTSIQIVMLVWTFTLIPHNYLFLFHVIRLPLFSICWWCGASSAFLLNGCCCCLYFFPLTHSRYHYKKCYYYYEVNITSGNEVH